MDSFEIIGGQELKGFVNISGAKNAALPILCGTLLTEKEISLTNLPKLQDVYFMLEILKEMGAKTYFNDNAAKITCGQVTPEAEYDLVRKMRASILVLGPLLARYGEAKVSLPGGCAIGARPIDLHLAGMKKLGALIDIEQGYVKAKAKRLIGAHYKLAFPSVGATENVLMAMTLARGESKLENAAMEPEIVDLIKFLNLMGAEIKDSGNGTILVQGKEELGGCEHQIITDRIEAATFLIATAIAGGEVELSYYEEWILKEVEDVLKKIGVSILRTDSKVLVKSAKTYKTANIVTKPFPGFPTDVQAQLMALLSLVPGTSVIEETIFENRFMHVPELIRMGADITLEGNTATINGVNKLTGAPVMATDLRASAGLVIAALRALNKTTISRVYHIDRGYEEIEKKLQKLGANIKRVKIDS